MLLSQINFSSVFRSPLKTVGFLASPLGSFLSNRFNGGSGSSGCGGGVGGAGPRGFSCLIGLPGSDIS